jgi:hypothetical protein
MPLSVTEVLREGLGGYAQRYGPIPAEYSKVLGALFDCRTGALGSHIYRCERCEHELLLHHSCRNRHCPTCQKINQAVWVQEHMENLLPVQYFHIVFTLPSELNEFVIRNRKACYRLLFDAASQTLLELSADPKWLGAQIGFIAVLHTWGQRLDAHPHLHCIVPGGGVCKGEKRFKFAQSNFFIPFRVLARLYRGKFMSAFKEAIAANDIVFHGSLKRFRDEPRLFRELTDTLYSKDWVVYAKESLRGPQAVIKYLGQYTHRVAISDKRILSLNDGAVSFAYKDYAAGGENKSMSLSATEFVRRFLLHVLPAHFVRIRHYGLLANRNKASALKEAFELFGQRLTEKTDLRRLPWHERVKKLLGKDPMVCRECGKGLLALYQIITLKRGMCPVPNTV